MNSGIKKLVTAYESGSFLCSRCRKSFTPENFKSLPYYGDTLIKWAMDQHVTYGISLKNITNILAGTFNIKASIVEVCNFKEKLANTYYETYEEIRQPL